MTNHVKHSVWVEDGYVFMANDDDGYSVERFETDEQVDKLIVALGEARDMNQANKVTIQSVPTCPLQIGRVDATEIMRVTAEGEIESNGQVITNDDAAIGACMREYAKAIEEKGL